MFSFPSQMKHAAKRIYKRSPGRSGVRRPDPDDDSQRRTNAYLTWSYSLLGRSLDSASVCMGTCNWAFES